MLLPGERKGVLMLRKVCHAVDRYTKACGWKDLAMMKVCFVAMGVLMGIALPARKKRVGAWAASLLFVSAYVPLMAKFLPFLLRDRVDIADIYTEDPAEK